MNVKVVFVDNQDSFLDDEFVNVDLIKELIKLNGFSSKANEMLFLHEF